MAEHAVSGAWSYDAIAEVYATDMGRSMPFDDVAFYRDLAAAHAGPVLELGCGTGRILIELLAAGVEAFGIDRSLPMLARLCRDAQARGLMPRVAQSDLRALGVGGHFGTILLPYSLVTYLTEPAQASAVLRELRTRLASGGRIVLDAFVPQPVQGFADFRLDYRRPHADGLLEREKRIAVRADGCNRIERRYRRYAGDGLLCEEFVTDETIRPYTPADLAALAGSAGLGVRSWHWDYGTRRDAVGARFASLVLAID